MPRNFLPITVATCLLALAGCSGGPNDDLASNCTVDRTVIGRLSFCLPDGWQAMQSTIGEVGNYVVNIHDGVSGIVMQIHVKKDPLNEPVHDNLAFAQRAVAIARDTAPHYSPISTEPVAIDGQETILHIFDASPSGEEEDTVRYYQYVLVHSSIAYGLTGILTSGGNADLQEVLEDVFTNVRFI